MATNEDQPATPPPAPSGKPSVSPAPFVEKIVSDPKNPPDALLLSGYVGTSSEVGHTRLYLDPALRTYVEIPSDAILHTEEIPRENSVLGGSLVWIQRNAELVHGTATPDRIRATFLEGRLQQTFGAVAAAPAAPARAAFGPRPTVMCPTRTGDPTCMHAACTIHIACGPTDHCGTALCGPGGTGPFCGTGAFVCGETAGCTSGPECGGPF